MTASAARRTFVLSGLVSLALTAAACGGGGGGGGSGATDDTQTNGEGATDDTQTNGEGATDDTETNGEDTATAFYEGKTIEIIVPAGPGGGADTTARLIGPRLTELLPGNPDVVIENIEGGGTILGSNEYALEREADGTSLLIASASALGAYAIGQEAVQYDPRDFEFLAGFPSGLIFYTSPNTGINEPADMLNPDEPLVLGSTSATGIGTLSLLAIEVLGIQDQVQVVSGYDGAGAARVAFEQGELNLNNQTGQGFTSEVQPLVDAGVAVPLFSLGVPDAEGNLVTDPAFPDLPTIVEFHEEMHGEPPSGPAWDAFQELMGIIPYLPLVIHADAPPEAVDALLGAFEELQDDPGFQEQKVEVAGDYPLWVGDEWDAITQTLEEFDPETKAWVQDWLMENYDVTGLTP